jgi:OOP family OmpA-OmpF porin
MMKGALRIAFAGTVALTMSGSALADDMAPVPDDAGKFEVDGFAGWHHFNENNELGARDVDDAFSADPGFAFGLRLGYWILPMLGIEAEGVVIPTEDRKGQAEQIILGYRLNALFQFPMGKVKPFVLVGAGGMSNSSEKNDILLDDSDFVAHVGLGARFDVGDTWGVRVDGRWLFPPSSESEGVTSDFEAFLGLYKTFGGEAIMEHVEVVTDDEPEATDEDGDGIFPPADQCPTEPEDKDGFEDDNGCPDPDNDGDGIADGADKCPMEAETVNNIDDGDGCPEQDEDGDGIVGSTDQCPTEPEDKDGFEDENGCPDPDNDGDGVLDADDKCPAEAETMNGYQDNDGCKDDVPKAVLKFTGVIKGINFKTNSPDLTKGSFRTLDKAMKVLTDYPDVRMEIQGHTDDTVNPKDPDFNRTLSQKRAETVKEYFVSKGIPADRLEAKGYGPDKPIDPRKTAGARAKNRRVEFQLITGQAPAAPTTPTKDTTNPGTPAPQPTPPPNP